VSTSLFHVTSSNNPCHFGLGIMGFLIHGTVSIRTMLDIDDDILEAAKAVARRTDKTAGAARWDPARRALTTTSDARGAEVANKGVPAMGLDNFRQQFMYLGLTAIGHVEPRLRPHCRSRARFSSLREDREALSPPARCEQSLRAARIADRLRLLAPESRRRRRAVQTHLTPRESSARHRDGS
jgi:hypothetical protein